MLHVSVVHTSKKLPVEYHVLSTCSRLAGRNIAGLEENNWHVWEACKKAMPVRLRLARFGRRVGSHPYCSNSCLRHRDGADPVC